MFGSMLGLWATQPLDPYALCCVRGSHINPQALGKGELENVNLKILKSCTQVHIIFFMAIPSKSTHTVTPSGTHIFRNTRLLGSEGIYN